MAARSDRKFDDWDYSRAAKPLHEGILPVSSAELTDLHFIRGVALALRAEWEGEGYFVAAAGSQVSGGPEWEADADWSEYRAESIAAILSFLHMLDNRGFRIVRKAN